MWMLENAVYSVISPEGCASILWKDAGKADEAAQRLRLTARDALELGIIEKIIPERDLGQPAFMACWRTVWKRSFTCSWDREEPGSSAATRASRLWKPKTPGNPAPGRGEIRE